MNIGICNSLSTLNEIAKLRYEVYFEELRKEHIDGIDHDFSTLSGKSDLKSPIILFAKRDSELIGTLRYRELDFDKDIKNKYHINKPDAHLQYSEIDLFMVRKEFRKSRASLLLACETYYLGLFRGTNIGLIQVEKYLEKFYLRLGFKVIMSVHYDYGERVQMYLDLWDVEHLLSLKSPFMRYYYRYKKEASIVSNCFSR